MSITPNIQGAVSMRNFKVSSTWLSGLAFVASALIVPSGMVIAQDEGEEQLEEIIVTGSRIARDPGSYVGPMMVLDGTSIREDGNFGIGCGRVSSATT